MEEEEKGGSRKEREGREGELLGKRFWGRRSSPQRSKARKDFGGGEFTRIKRTERIETDFFLGRRRREREREAHAEAQRARRERKINRMDKDGKGRIRKGREGRDAGRGRREDSLPAARFALAGPLPLIKGDSYFFLRAEEGDGSLLSRGGAGYFVFGRVRRGFLRRFRIVKRFAFEGFARRIPRNEPLFTHLIPRDCLTRNPFIYRL